MGGRHVRSQLDYNEVGTMDRLTDLQPGGEGEGERVRSQMKNMGRDDILAGGGEGR